MIILLLTLSYLYPMLFVLLIFYKLINKSKNKDILIFKLFVFFVLSICIISTGNLFIIGDSHGHWKLMKITNTQFYEEEVQCSIVNIKNSVMKWMIISKSDYFELMANFNPHQISSYGNSVYLKLISLMSLMLSLSPFDLKLINILLSFFSYFIFIKTLNKLNIDLLLIRIIFIIFPIYWIWSLFLLKDTFFVLNSQIIFYVFLLRKKMITKLLILSPFVILMVLTRVKMGIFILGVFTGLFIYYHLKKRLMAMFISLMVIFHSSFSGYTEILYRRLVLLNMGHNNTGGYCFKVIDSFFYHARNVPENLNQFYLSVKGIINCFWQPNSFYFYNLNYGMFQFYHVIWLFFVILFLFGLCFMIINGKLNSFYQVLLLYILAFAIIIGIGDGNIGTLIRHRSIIEPFVFIFSAVGLSIIIPTKKVKIKMLNQKESYETY